MKTKQKVSNSIKSFVFAAIALFSIASQTGVAHAAPALCYAAGSDGKLVSNSCPAAYNKEDTCYFLSPVNLGTGNPDSIINCAEAANGKLVTIGPVDAPEAENPVQPPAVPDNTSDTIVPIEENPIIIWLVYLVNVALAGVGLVVVGAIIYSGIQYMVSQGNPQKTADARNRIISSLVAVALYALMFVILQWLIPGGVFD